MNFQMFKLDLEKAEEPENKLPAWFKALQKFKARRDYIQFRWDGPGIRKSFMKMGFQGWENVNV